ncbi:TPA: hypothetical protein U5D50_004288, partial [Yersinia enterocolitica]|nr:hypothetical protein [Yersinia enterocolitica]
MSDNDSWIDMEHIRNGKKYHEDKSSSVNSRKNNIAYTKAGKSSSGKNTNHVVVKVTGGAKSADVVKRKMEYDARDNPEEIYFNEDDQIISLDRAVRIATEDFRLAKSAAKNNVDDEKMNYNMVFSMHSKTEEKALMAAVGDTLKESFSGQHNYFYTLHNDTKNNHVHVTVSKAAINVDGKNLHLDKKKLNKLKSDFAKNLNKRGIKAEFNSHSEAITEKQREKAAESRRLNRELADTYRVLEYGKAKYQNDGSKPDSYYIKMVSLKGVEKTVWSKGLQSEIEGKNIAIGETIKLKKLNPKDDVRGSQWVIDRHAVADSQVFRGNVIRANTANYMNKKTGKESFFVAVQDESGTVHQFWNKDFKKAFDKAGVKAGDSVEFVIARDKFGVEHPKFRKIDPAMVKIKHENQAQSKGQSSGLGM